MEKLPIDFKTKWIAALRSGEYIQGMTYLFNEDTGNYCCLGVACIISGISKDEIKNKMIIPDSFSEVPDIIKGGAGNNDIVDTLTKINDGYNSSNVSQKSFEEIADYIEQNL